MKNAKRPVGRPLTGPEPLDQTLYIYVTRSQKAALVAVSERLGISLGEVVRRWIDDQR